MKYTNESRLRIWWMGASIVAFLWATFSVYFLWRRRLYFIHETDLIQNHLCMEIWAAFIVTTWAVGPPVWFAFEAAWLISVADMVNKPKRMAAWKVGSGAAKAMWVGVGTLIAGLYIKWNAG